MSTAATLQIDSTSSNDSSALGEAIGRKCRGGEVFELISDLGGGKTTFVQGLAAGLDSKDRVASPTFMVEKVYDGRDGIALHHFDFYRLNEAGLVGAELAEAAEDPRAIIAVEWGEVAHNVLPENRVKIHFLKTGDDSRRITIEYIEEQGYLFKGIT